MSQRNRGQRGYGYESDPLKNSYESYSGYEQGHAYRQTVSPRQGYGMSRQSDPYFESAGRGYAQQAAYGQQQGGGYQQYSRPGAYQERKTRSRGTGSLVIAALVGLFIGALAMFVVSALVPDVPSPVDVTLTESQLNTTVGTYRYAGETYEISAREAILGSVSLESMQNADGSYEAPSSDMILSYARNRILAQLVADNGITVTADEVASYALSIVGTSDVASVAAYFDMGQEQAYGILTEAAAVRKLRESVVARSATAPVPPAVPVDGNTEVGNALYADYIVSLLGPYWDVSTGTWNDTSNAYYAALSNQVFAAGSANYNAAQIAYTIAYDQFLEGADTSDAWTAYVNEYLGDAAISIATLKA